MNIRDKLIDDRTKLFKDIDKAMEKLEEYLALIDALSKKLELAKEAILKIKDEALGGDVDNIYNTADETLQKLEE